MAGVADELKRKRAEIGLQIEELRNGILELQKHEAAFDVVIRSYEPDYIPESSRAHARGRKPNGGDASGIGMLFQGVDRRSFVLRTLREAGKPIATADFAVAFAREKGIGDQDPRLGQIGNRFSQVLDQLAKANRVRKAGKIDGQRFLWEVAT